jgi:hypothetical protein
VASRIELINARDFTGGLNLSPNVMQLGEAESPDLSNVDISERGGFRLRKGVDTYADALTADPLSIHGFIASSGTQQVIVADGTNLKYTTGTTWSTLAARTGPCTSVMFKNNMYLSNGVSGMCKWTGAVATTLAQGFNDDLSAPVAGKAPIAKFSAVYKGSVFVANTVESAVAYPNRVRWSHPNQPEDWVSYHYIDIDPGADGDEITAMVPFDDRLIVFKRKSIHVVFGDPPEGLSTYPVSHEVGAVSQAAVAASESGVYFFDWPGGVFRYNGRQIEWLFERLSAAIKNGDINSSQYSKVQLGFGNRRLWVSVPTSGSTTVNSVYVLTPALGSGGAWVQYDLSVGPYFNWTPSQTGTALFLAGYAAGDRLLKLDQPRTTDEFGAGAVHIDAHYQTPWFDLGQPAMKKRWRRPEAVLLDGQDAEVRVDVMRDYDPNNAVRQFHFTTTASAEDVMVWGPGYGLWGDPWGGSVDEAWVVDRGSPIGAARAVSLRFRSPLNDVDWGVNAFVLKVTPRKVRS